MSFSINNSNCMTSEQRQSSGLKKEYFSQYYMKIGTCMW